MWLLAIFLLGDSALRAVRTNLTLGNAMMYGITVAVWGYALFQRRVDAFCAAGAGRVLKYVFFAGCGAYLLFALGLFAASFADPATGNEKAVVVLGAGLRGEQVSGLLACPLDAALADHRQNPDVLLVVSGGQGPDEAIPEAEAMARYLQAHGVPGENILKEEKSESTQQNFEFSRALLEQAGIRADEPIADVTNRFHIYRSGIFARKGRLYQRPCHSGLHQLWHHCAQRSARSAGRMPCVGIWLKAHKVFFIRWFSIINGICIYSVSQKRKKAPAQPAQAPLHETLKISVCPLFGKIREAFPFRTVAFPPALHRHHAPGKTGFSAKRQFKRLSPSSLAGTPK